METRQTAEQIADEEAERICRLISERVALRAQQVSVSNPDEAIAKAGAVLALGEVMADIQARRHRRT